MDHDTAQSLFISYHDGDLDGKERKDLEQHLTSCEKCNAEWESYRRTVDEISGLNHLAPSKDFASRVEQTIGKRSAGRFFGDQQPSSLSFAIISFVLILFIILGYLLITGGMQLGFVEPVEKETPPPIESNEESPN